LGKTSLFSGERVEKSHPHVEACGEVDELNSHLGLLISNLPAKEKEIIREIHDIQSLLLHIGARLSSSPSSPLLRSLRQIREEDIRGLEQSIDRMEETLPSLTGFILPGGHPSAAVAHVSRAVCRRAERRVAALSGDGREKGEPDTVLIYLNRLSDYLFMLARYVNQITGAPETPWKRR
jgi:cob(I)alamin adenosyltransferase